MNSVKFRNLDNLLLDTVIRENAKLKRQLAAADAVEKQNNDMIDDLMHHIEKQDAELMLLRGILKEVGDTRGRTTKCSKITGSPATNNQAMRNHPDIFTEAQMFYASMCRRNRDLEINRS